MSNTDDLPAMQEPVAWYCTSCGGLQLHEGAEAGDNWCSECGSVGTMKRMVASDAVAQRDEQLAKLTAEVEALRTALRDLVQLEADGHHAGESAIEYWERARAALAARAEAKDREA